MPKGTSRDIVVTVTAKNLAGATAVCTFVTLHGLTPLLTKRSTDAGISVAGGVDSVITVHLAPTDTGVLTVGQYLWELRVTLLTVQEIIESGSLILTDNDTYGVV